MPRQNPQQKLLNKQQKEGVPTIHQPTCQAFVQPGKSYASVANINATKQKDDNEFINNDNNENNEFSVAQVLKQMQDNMNNFMNMMQNMNSMMVLLSQKQK